MEADTDTPKGARAKAISLRNESDFLAYSAQEMSGRKRIESLIRANTLRESADMLDRYAAFLEKTSVD